MRCFIDTSAFIALLNGDDHLHPRARKKWQDLLSQDAFLVTSNYVALETFSLAKHRIGLQASKDFHDAMLAVVEISWVTEDIHNVAATSVILSGKRTLSLVDCTSFEIMRRLGLEKAFAYDRHFRDQGFELVG